MGGIAISLSVRLSVCLSCPFCSAYSSGWFLSILGTNDPKHKRVCRATWPLTLTFIFKVIQPWFCNNKYDMSCRVRSTASTVLGGFFPYLAQMITMVRGCVALDILWTWPLSSRAFSHGFAVKLMKYGTSCRVRSTACTVLDVFFPYLAQMITSIRECVARNNLWPWPVPSRSFSHDSAVKLLKYGIYCRVRCIACTVLDSVHIWHKLSLGCEGVSRSMTFDLDLQGHSAMTLQLNCQDVCGTYCLVCFTAYRALDGFFPYSAQMITGIRDQRVCRTQWPLTLTYTYTYTPSGSAMMINRLLPREATTRMPGLWLVIWKSRDMQIYFTGNFCDWSVT